MKRHLLAPDQWILEVPPAGRGVPWSAPVEEPSLCRVCVRERECVPRMQMFSCPGDLRFRAVDDSLNIGKEYRWRETSEL